MADKNSFILYTDFKEYFEMMSFEKAGEVLMAIFSYQACQTVPAFDDGMQNMLFKIIKNQLDRDQEKWAETVNKRAENGKKGGRPKKADVFCSEYEKEEKAEVYDEDNKEPKKAEVFFDEDEKPKKPNAFLGFEKKAKKAVNENVNEYENVNEHEYEHVTVDVDVENVRACETFENKGLSEPQKNYAEQVFDIYFANNLPGSKDFITFSMRDFRLALDELRNMHLHSADVVRAVNNYAQVIALKRKGMSWWDSEQTFFNFCKNKTIVRFLDDSFNINDYAKTKTHTTENAEDYSRRIMEQAGVNT